MQEKLQIRCRAKLITDLTHRHSIQCSETAILGESLCWLHQLILENNTREIEFLDEKGKSYP